MNEARIEALETEVKELRERLAKLEADLSADVPAFRPYKVQGLEVRYVRDETGCSLRDARRAVEWTRGDLPAAVARIQDTGLATR